MSATISELDADYGPGGAAGVQLKTVGQVHRLALDTLIEVDCATFDDILSRNGLANLSGQRHQLMPFIHSAKTDGNLAATDDLTETPAQMLRGLVSVHCHAALELIATRSEATLA